VLETASKKLSAEVVTVSLATSHAYSTSSVTALSTTSGLPLATSTTRGPSTCSLRRPSPTPSFDGGGAGGIEDLDPGAELQGGPASTLAQAPTSALTGALHRPSSYRDGATPRAWRKAATRQDSAARRLIACASSPGRQQVAGLLLPGSLHPASQSRASGGDGLAWRQDRRSMRLLLSQD
jgi:hypothetical protein